MKILVTGSNGMLGDAVKKIFIDDELYLTDVFNFDVRNDDLILNALELFPSIEAIIHLAAETDLESCQLIPQNAFFTNTIGTINMMRLAKKLNVPIIYMSTAGIFDGNSKDNYIETDIPNPINIYGLSKYYGEIGLKEYDKVYIVRMSWAMGGGEHLDKKFVNQIYKLIKSGRERLYVVDDKIGSPTYTIDVARALRFILYEKFEYGTYHCSGIGAASRFDVAKEMVKILNKNISVIPVQSSYYEKIYSCPRARNEGLSSTKNLMALFMTDWQDALKRYLKGYYGA
jgi:dTDP-4-dehydrorhamnose reductase